VSVHVSSWAWKQKVGDPGTKLVLVKLADNADDNGYSYWRQKNLAAECEMARSTCQKKIEKLVELSIVEVIPRFGKDGEQLANGYRIIRPSTVPENEAGGADSGEAGGATPGRAAGTVKGSSSSSSRGPTTISGRKVTDDEHDLVDLLLARFNEKAGGTRFAGKSWRESIVRRMREHPEVTGMEHLAIIDKQFERKWWKGDPTPSVIWGSDRVFDRALNGAQGPQQEIDEFTRD
jgi:hypothetical protein